MQFRIWRDEIVCESNRCGGRIDGRRNGEGGLVIGTDGGGGRRQPNPPDVRQGQGAWPRLAYRRGPFPIVTHAGERYGLRDVAPSFFDFLVEQGPFGYQNHPARLIEPALSLSAAVLLYRLDIIVHDSPR